MNSVYVARVVCLCMSAIFFLNGEPFSFNIQGEAGFLYNPDNGRVLFEKNAHTPLYPASTTKIAVALYALNQIGDKLDERVVVSEEALRSATQWEKSKSSYAIPSWYLEPDGVKIGLKKGELISWRVLLEGLLIASGNDSATVIAEQLGPGVPRFMDKLNRFLVDMGCKETSYYNPNGFHHPLHVTTAHDLALMTKEALKNPQFCRIVKQEKFVKPKSNLQGSATFMQTNRLIRSGAHHYPHCIGVKTGYHARAKKTFVGAASVEGRTLILVLLGYQDPQEIFRESKKIFEKAFDQKKVEKIYLSSGDQTYERGIENGEEPVKTYLKKPLVLTYYPAEEVRVKGILDWYPVKLPVWKDSPVGEIKLLDNQGEILGAEKLWARETVREKWPFRAISQ